MLTALKMKEKEKSQQQQLQQQQQQEEEEESCVSSADACSQSRCESVSPQPATISITTPTVLPTTTSQPATKPPPTHSTSQPVTSASPIAPPHTHMLPLRRSHLLNLLFCLPLPPINQSSHPTLLPPLSLFSLYCLFTFSCSIPYPPSHTYHQRLVPKGYPYP